ncbi:hypothetical protein T4B_12341 [Trichinella pseudospiralis]|uniref:Uncharacterized protein n=1 Tax=Trichinella pseudospiralis TaxID=6337 RepID=A0A0V1GJ77_TRIPS|nr:hypothetical protein T4B_12341 [Trichinella pseudospiralis]
MMALYFEDYCVHDIKVPCFWGRNQRFLWKTKVKLLVKLGNRDYKKRRHCVQKANKSNRKETALGFIRCVHVSWYNSVESCT